MTTRPPLPKSVLPTFDAVLPFSKKPVKYRAFNRREQRSLLTAQEAVKPQRDGEMPSLKPLLEALVECIESVTGIDPRTIPTIDTEFLILKIRSASIDNELQLSFLDDETGEDIKIKAKIDAFDAVIPEGFTTNLKLDDNMVLQMRLPTWIDLFEMSDSSKPMIDRIAKMTADCIVMMYQGDIEYDLSLYTFEEKLEFLESFSDEQLSMIEQFFENAPRMRREIRYKTKAGKQKSLVIEGMNHFFTSW